MVLHDENLTDCGTRTSCTFAFCALAFMVYLQTSEKAESACFVCNTIIDIMLVQNSSFKLAV